MPQGGSTASDSPRNATRYLGQDYRFAPSYLRSRDPTSSDIKPKEQQGRYPVGSFWINTVGQHLWVLPNYNTSTGAANWVPIIDAGNPVDALTGNTGTATADSTGNINVTGAAGSGISTSGSGNTLAVTMSSPFLGGFAFGDGSQNTFTITNTGAANSFNNPNFISNAGQTQTVTTIPVESQWLIMASSNTVAPDPTYFAVGLFLGYGSGTFIIVNINNNNIGWAVSGNTVQLINSAGTIHLNITGYRFS